MVATLSTLVVSCGLPLSMVGAGVLAGSLETDRASSLICILFLFRISFGVFTTMHGKSQLWIGPLL